MIDQDRCTLCSSCAKLCPTGAIDYSERSEPGYALLSFLEDSCVQCGICAAGCPEAAVALQPRLAPIAERSERRIAAHSAMATCTDCAVPFVAETLLISTLNRLRERGASTAVLEQTARCPRCRAARLG
ncbi:MAG: ATP-binding protein [Chromatocurvus sp.]